MNSLYKMLGLSSIFSLFSLSNVNIGLNFTRLMWRIISRCKIIKSFKQIEERFNSCNLSICFFCLMRARERDTCYVIQSTHNITTKFQYSELCEWVWLSGHDKMLALLKIAFIEQIEFAMKRKIIWRRANEWMNEWWK